MASRRPTAGVKEAILNLMKCYFGSGMLGLPFAFVEVFIVYFYLFFIFFFCFLFLFFIVCCFWGRVLQFINILFLLFYWGKRSHFKPDEMLFLIVVCWIYHFAEVSSLSLSLSLLLVFVCYLLLFIKTYGVLFWEWYVC